MIIMVGGDGVWWKGLMEACPFHERRLSSWAGLAIIIIHQGLGFWFVAKLEALGPQK